MTYFVLIKDVAICMDESSSKIIDEVCTNAMCTHFKPIKCIYMDLRLLKDLRLGWLLANCNEQELAYVVSNIDKYNGDLIHRNSFTYAFPELNHKEDYLQSSYNDNLEEALNYAPDTNIFIHLNDILTEAYMQNKHTEFSGFITLVVNVYPLPMSDLVKKYADTLSLAFNNIAGFKFFSSDPLKLSPELWDTFSAIYVCDIDKLSSSPDTPWLKHTTEGRWINKHIFAAPVISDEVIKIHENDENEWVNDCLRNTEAAMCLCCNFQFIDPFIPVKE